MCGAGFLQLDPKAYNQKTSPTSKGGKGGGVMEGRDGCEPDRSLRQGGDVLGIPDQAEVINQRNLCQVPVRGGVQSEGGNEQAE